MTATMRAVVLDAPGPPEALRIRELPVPEPRPGWVLIRVKAFGSTAPSCTPGWASPRASPSRGCSASRPPASSPLPPEASSGKVSKSPR